MRVASDSRSHSASWLKYAVVARIAHPGAVRTIGQGRAHFVPYGVSHNYHELPEYPVRPWSPARAHASLDIPRRTAEPAASGDELERDFLVPCDAFETGARPWFDQAGQGERESTAVRSALLPRTTAHCGDFAPQKGQLAKMVGDGQR